jgi:DNA-binding NarL/FixJ family response regulator
MSEVGSIRILVVDDHRLFRDGLAALLDGAADTVVVGYAETGAEAIEKLEELEPDVVLMDIMMPQMNGIEATRKIRADFPDIQVVMLTMLEDDDSLFAAMCAGAQGYILKERTRPKCYVRCVPLPVVRLCSARRWPRSSPAFSSMPREREYR